MMCRSEAGGSPPIHWPIIGSGVSLMICIPGTWMHPAVIIQQRLITAIKSRDFIVDINSF
jgi:hypothetical protein